MKTYYPLGKDSEDTEERPMTKSVTDEDLRGLHRSTRQIWAEEEKHDALLDGWRACLKRRIAAEKRTQTERTTR